MTISVTTVQYSVLNSELVIIRRDYLEGMGTSSGCSNALGGWGLDRSKSQGVGTGVVFNPMKRCILSAIVIALSM